MSALWRVDDNMNLYLAGFGAVLNGTICKNCKAGGDNVNLYLAEGGSLFQTCYKDNISRGGKMDIYLAGTETRATQLHETQKAVQGGCGYTSSQEIVTEKSGCEGRLFEGTNILQSFYYCNDFTEQVIIPQSKRFMLDSGAFTFFSSGKNVNWDEYVKKYGEFINRNNVKLYFELDIDKLIGYEKVLYYRHKLEDMTGKACIPVWHKFRGQENFIEMCEQYNYVAIGGIVTKEITQKEYKYFPQLIKTAHKNGARIHGLGFTNLKGLTQYKFDSVDSTSWVSGNRFGSIYMFDGETMVKHDKKEGQRLADSRKVALHNFKEWVKFQQYAESHL